MPIWPLGGDENILILKKKTVTQLLPRKVLTANKKECLENNGRQCSLSRLLHNGRQAHPSFPPIAKTQVPNSGIVIRFLFEAFHFKELSLQIDNDRLHSFKEHFFALFLASTSLLEIFTLCEKYSWQLH